MWFNIKKHKADDYTAETRRKTIRGAWADVSTQIDSIISGKFDRKQAWNAKIEAKKAKAEAQHALESSKINENSDQMVDVNKEFGNEK